jgi:hypothetical protein
MLGEVARDRPDSPRSDRRRSGAHLLYSPGRRGSENGDGAGGVSL